MINMNGKIIKLTQTETNEILNIMREEEPAYGLILTLQYIYGRNVSEVYNLKKTDIDKDNDTITFTMNGDKLTFPVHIEIKQLLYKIVDEAKKVNIFQEGDRPLSNVKDGINYYLHKKLGSLSDLPYLEDLRLTTKDFKALRGQHLYIDGVPFKTIHELYHNTNTDGTKNTINYEELKEMYDKTDILSIVEDTCVSVYTEHSFDNNPVFYVTMDDEEALLELTGESVNFYGDEPLKEVFDTIDSELLLRSLENIKVPGDYTMYNGVKFLKN